MLCSYIIKLVPYHPLASVTRLYFLWSERRNNVPFLSTSLGRATGSNPSLSEVAILFAKSCHHDNEPHLLKLNSLTLCFCKRESSTDRSFSLARSTMNRLGLLCLLFCVGLALGCVPPDCDHEDCGSCGRLYYILYIL